MVKKGFLTLVWIQISFSINSCSKNFQVSNPHSVYKSATVRLVPASNQEYVIKEHETFVMQCIARGHPKPSIQWTIYGGGLVKRKDLNLLNSTLVIQNISRFEGGRVSCKATNGIGRGAFATRDIRVIYLDKPALTIRLPAKESTPSTSIWVDNTVRIQCEVTSNPGVTFTWRMNGSIVQSNEEKGISIQRIASNKYASISVLRIKNAQREGYGKYECLTSLDKVGQEVLSINTNDSITYSLKTASPQIRLTTPSNVIVNKGDTIRMNCEVYGGFPEPTTSWEKQHGLLSSKRILISQRNTLIISRAGFTDSGIYFCIGINEVGVPSQKKVQVTVRKLSSMTYWITPKKGETNLSFGTDVWLSCHADAEPYSELQYSWYKMSSQNKRVLVRPDLIDDMTISDLNQEQVEKRYTIPAKSSRLEILDLTYDDYGVYVCSATLSGFRNKSIEISSFIPVHRTSAPPSITARSNNIVANEGSNVTLECLANGQSSTIFRFYREENISMPSGNMEDLSQTGRLLLSNVSRDASGLYVCSAAQFNGFTQVSPDQPAAYIQVEVTYPPMVHPSYDLIRKPQGSELNISCFVSDSLWESPVSYQWSKDGVLQGKLQPRQYLYYRSIDVNHYGIYTCVVTNAFGSNKCIINVTGAAYPPEFYYSDQDTSYLQYSNQKATSLYSYRLSWTQKLPNAVEHVTKYRIRWCPFQNHTQWKQAVIDIRSALKYGQLITFCIRDLRVGSYIVEVFPVTSSTIGSSSSRTILVHSRGSNSTVRGFPAASHSLERDFSCSFDDIRYCNFAQSSEDNFDWSFNNKNNQLKRTKNTGPDLDHTNSEREGGYMFIESSNVRVRDKAQLVSPLFYTETPQERCLEFFYHMKGPHIGKLRVLITKRSGVVSEMWRKNGEQANGWQHAAVKLLPTKQFQVIFEAVMTVENGFQGDIAIDDVRITANKCVTNINNAQQTSGTERLQSYFKMNLTLFPFQSLMSLNISIFSNYYLCFLSLFILTQFFSIL